MPYLLLGLALSWFGVFLGALERGGWEHDLCGSTSSASGLTTGVTSGGDSSSSTTAVDSSGSSDSSSDNCSDEVFPGKLADVDIAMVIDGSPAIADNALDIQNMLDDLSATFPLDITHRFILTSPVEGAVPQFCVPPRLGQQVCGNPRFPHFTHRDVETSVPEGDPLGVLAMELNAGIPEVRPASQKHLVVVTDGDISTTPATAVSTVRGLGPGFANVRIHAVSGGKSVGCQLSPGLDEAVALTFGTSTPLCSFEGADASVQELLAPQPSCIFDISNLERESIATLTLAAGASELGLELVGTLLECASNVPGAAITPVMGVQSLVLCPSVCAMYQDVSSQFAGELTVSVCE